MQNTVKLDEIDHKIMNLLYENARISVSEIGLTQPAVKERINKLEDQGVIAAYRTKFEPAKLIKTFKHSSCLKRANALILFNFVMPLLK